MELIPVFLINKGPVHKSGKTVPAPLIEIIPQSCTELSLSLETVLTSTVFTNMYLSLEGFIAFLKAAVPTGTKNLFQKHDMDLSLKSSRLGSDYICLLPWTIHHKEEDSWLLILIESLTGWSPECNAGVNYFTLSQKHSHPLVLVKDRLSLSNLHPAQNGFFLHETAKDVFFLHGTLFFFYPVTVRLKAAFIHFFIQIQGCLYCLVQFKNSKTNSPKYIISG